MANTEKAKAQKAEAQEETFKFDFNGAEYEVYFEDLQDLELLEYFAEGMVPQGLKVLLGDEQYQAFKDNNRNARGRVPAEVAGQFIDALYEAGGLKN